ncbi:MAG: hypothetical protein J6T67_01630 [Paludibacteraceae bacterium]|nr:hypothetical protein [Paludibacteraceae bacterium]
MRKIFTYNKFACLATALATMFVLSSCGDDDNDDNGNGNNSCNYNNNEQYTNTVDKAIVADEADVMVNWKCVSYKGYAISKGKALEYKWTDDVDDKYYYFLDAESGFEYAISSYNKTTEKSVVASWKYSNGYIYMYDDGEKHIYTIISLTKTEMVIRERFGDETAGEYYDYSFIKVDESIDEHIRQKNSQQDKNKSLEIEVISGKEYKFSNEALGIGGTLKVISTSITDDYKRITFNIITNDGRNHGEFTLGNGISDCANLMWDGSSFMTAFEDNAADHANMIVLCVPRTSTQGTISSTTSNIVLISPTLKWGATDTYFWQE